MVPAVLAIGMLAAGAIIARPNRDPPAPPERGYQRVHRGVCHALERARLGDPAGARRTFFNRAHAPLHQLAAEVAGSNRPRATRLLEAKESVEAEVDSSLDLASHLDRLAAATRAAMAAVGQAEPKPCSRR